ncbi:sigma 54-interacting transcriptional regulator [Salinicoccus sp. CNSTN-B1]
MKVPREEVYDENKNRNFDSVSYNSSVMASTLKIAGEMAKTSNTIHITGEPGAGKQMMAEMIHNESDNQRYPFYIYNCLDKDESMIDEALFGKKEKGGSVLNAKKHGTIYIKNIEGLPYLMQNKLANFLDSDNHKRKIRVITSSFEDSFTLYSGGTLSQRLYSHLSSYTLNIPSIAERKRIFLF